MSDPTLSEELTESFYGFELTDEQVGAGPFQPVAIELKHVFESLYRQANEANEEMFLSVELQRVLTDFLWNPSADALTCVLTVSPSLREALMEITRLVAPSLVRQIPEASNESN